MGFLDKRESWFSAVARSNLLGGGWHKKY